MVVYHVRPEEGFEWVVFGGPSGGVFDDWNGTSRGALWIPPAMQLLRENPDGGRRSHADFPWLGFGPLALTPAAVAAVGDLVRRTGELLPIACEGEELVCFNCLLMGTAVDHAAGELVERVPPPPAPWVPARRVPLDDVGLFVLEDGRGRRSRPYATERFVREVAAHGLRGLRFERAGLAGG